MNQILPVVRKMKKINIVLIVVAVLIIIAELILIAKSNLSLSKIIGPILTITGMILVIISVILNIKKQEKENLKKM